MTETKITFDRLIRWVITILVFTVLLLLVNRLSGVLIPFFLAILLAYYLNPIVLFFQNRLKVKKRSWAILLSFISVFSIISLLLLILIPLISNEIAQLQPVFTKFSQSQSIQTLEGLPSVIEDYIISFKSSAQFQNLLSGIDYQAVMSKLIDQSSAILGGSLDVLFGLFSVFTMVLYLVFIMIDYSTFSESWPKLIPQKFRTQSMKLVSDFQDGMDTYFKAQALVAFIVGVLFAIGFSIIGLPMAILFGLFVGLLNMVPYLQIFGLLPAAFLALMQSVDTGNSFIFCLAMVLLVFAIVQVIQDAILVPKIMGNVTSLNPAIILLSLSIWGSLLGVIGMLIAIPVSNLLVSYYKAFIQKNED
ncbi:MAG: AI-2E family transporter [Flavobacteriales bacterium]